MKMAVHLLLLPAILSSLFALSYSTSQEDHRLIAEVHQMKLKLARLESVLEESIQNINSNTLYLKEREKLIEEMDNKIHHLQSVLSSIKGDSLRTSEKLTALQEEVRLLWAASRKNNFDIHVLQSKAQDAEDRLKVVTSQVEKMADIVTEQWIQIQQLEQALQITDKRTLKIHKEVRSTRCTFFKFIIGLYGKQISDVSSMLDLYMFGRDSTLSSYMSQSLQQFRRLFSMVQKYHHELQGFIRRQMERNEITAALSNKEVVFFVASALITFPILSAWILLSSQFS